MRYLYRLEENDLPRDPAVIGGKAMGIRAIHDIRCPTLGSFVITTALFERIIRAVDADCEIREIERRLALGDEKGAAECASSLRMKIENHRLPADVCQEISRAAITLIEELGYPTLAVRSSCSAEDNTDHTFAGCFASYLNVPADEIHAAVLGVIASLYSSEALFYAHENGIRAGSLAMALIMQPAVDALAAGVGFSIDPQSADATTLVVDATSGLGVGLVSGRSTADRYIVAKGGLAPVSRRLSRLKSVQTVFAEPRGVTVVGLNQDQRRKYSIEWADAVEIGKRIVALETASGGPVDVEWLKNAGKEILIVQSRPLRSPPKLTSQWEELLPSPDDKALLYGQSITARIVRGCVRWMRDGKLDPPARPGEIIFAHTIDVDCFSSIKRATAIVTSEGGYTSHIGIIMREHGIPAIFAAGDKSAGLEDGDLVTVDCSRSEGRVFRGEIPSRIHEIDPASVYRPVIPTLLVSSNHEDLARILRLPLSGIGLVRMEFLIAKHVGIHPLAICEFDNGTLPPGPLRERIETAIDGFEDASSWYIETVCNAVCQFAVICPNQTVNVRLPDLLSDDYLVLAGGERYEAKSEANPMMGWRGTTKLISAEYRAALKLDCSALRQAISRRGFHNINILLPFCRIPADAEDALMLISSYGLRSARIGMMVEIPSNIVLGREFADLFDFFLVGPMDLTQFTYAADRKTTRLGRYNNETKATKEMVKIFLSLIAGCGKDVFIGGWPLFQYYPEYARLSTNNRLKLVELPDRLLELFEHLRQLERDFVFPAPAE